MHNSKHDWAVNSEENESVLPYLTDILSEMLFLFIWNANICIILEEMQTQSPKVKNKNKKTAVDFPLALTLHVLQICPVCMQDKSVSIGETKTTDIEMSGLSWSLMQEVLHNCHLGGDHCNTINA